MLTLKLNPNAVAYIVRLLSTRPYSEVAGIIGCRQSSLFQMPIADRRPTSQ